tara:strand:- start:1853 stop:3442 length:1590 start_codon:yes stop_codon:yes gene_type:complete
MEQNGDKVAVIKDTTTQQVSSFYRGTIVPSRGINEKTMRMYGYESIQKGDKRAEIASFYQGGQMVAQHLRGPNKAFRWIGEASGVSLWGQHLWKDKGGKRLVITEGEYDCMTVAQLFNLKWPVVSLPNGAAGAVRAIKDNLEFVSGYDEIVLMFDSDDPGKEAAAAVADILPPGKCKIAALPYKDANECLMKNNSQAVITAVWEAQRYSPDEILHVSTIVDPQALDQIKVYPFPFDSLTEFLIGQRSGEVTLWASGTGSGKSTIIRELIHHHLEEGRSVGAIMLEESPQETMDDMISLMLNKPVRVIRASRMMNDLRVSMGKEPIDMEIIDTLTDAEYADARTKLNKTSLYIYDHLGNNALKNLCSRMEYMAVSLGVEVIVLDHITSAATGLITGNERDFDGGSSERLLIDNIMKELRALVSRTGVRIEVISQLKKTNKAYEEGDRITLQDLRGSGSLSSVPNTVIGLERDRQNPDDRIANTTTVRILKNRLTGKAGVAACLYFNRLTGRLEELDWAQDHDGQIMFGDV